MYVYTEVSEGFNDRIEEAESLRTRHYFDWRNLVQITIPQIVLPLLYKTSKEILKG